MASWPPRLLALLAAAVRPCLSHYRTHFHAPPEQPPIYPGLRHGILQLHEDGGEHGVRPKTWRNHPLHLHYSPVQDPVRNDDIRSSNWRPWRPGPALGPGRQHHGIVQDSSSARSSRYAVLGGKQSGSHSADKLASKWANHEQSAEESGGQSASGGQSDSQSAEESVSQWASGGQSGSQLAAGSAGQWASVGQSGSHSVWQPGSQPEAPRRPGDLSAWKSQSHPAKLEQPGSQAVRRSGQSGSHSVWRSGSSSASRERSGSHSASWESSEEDILAEASTESDYVTLETFFNKLGGQKPTKKEWRGDHVAPTWSLDIPEVAREMANRPISTNPQVHAVWSQDYPGRRDDRMANDESVVTSDPSEADPTGLLIDGHMGEYRPPPVRGSHPSTLQYGSTWQLADSAEYGAAFTQAKYQLPSQELLQLPESNLSQGMLEPGLNNNHLHPYSLNQSDAYDYVTVDYGPEQTGDNGEPSMQIILPIKGANVSTIGDEPYSDHVPSDDLDESAVIDDAIPGEQHTNTSAITPAPRRNPALLAKTNDNGTVATIRIENINPFDGTLDDFVTITIDDIRFKFITKPDSNVTDRTVFEPMFPAFNEAGMGSVTTTASTQDMATPGARSTMIEFGGFSSISDYAAATTLASTREVRFQAVEGSTSLPMPSRYAKTVTIFSPFSITRIAATYSSPTAGNRTVPRVRIPVRGIHTFAAMAENSGTIMPIIAVSGTIAKKKFRFNLEPYTTGVHENLRFRIYVKCPRVEFKLESVDGHKLVKK